MPDQQKPELFIVTCSGLHRAVGPFLGLKVALTVALQMNKAVGKDGCTYVPVPFDAPFKVMDAPVEEAPQPKLRLLKPDHGYL